MNIWDIVIIVAVLGIAIFGTIRLKKKKGGCHGGVCVLAGTNCETQFAPYT